MIWTFKIGMTDSDIPNSGTPAVGAGQPSYPDWPEAQAWPRRNRLVMTSGTRRPPCLTASGASGRLASRRRLRLALQF
ncbi:hypothetical protein SB768_32690, partial [Burkholderia sp. SIMBA_043]|uniref:hypothetical protein n=1 Tax=Burkholderia sp. SIMBA_043 TaxID=3085784 RepID=UPI00397D0BA1